MAPPLFVPPRDPRPGRAMYTEWPFRAHTKKAMYTKRPFHVHSLAPMYTKRPFRVHCKRKKAPQPTVAAPFRRGARGTTFRGSRSIRSASCGPWRGAKPARGGRSWWPFSRGSRACSLSACCGAEMFFSLLYLFFVVAQNSFGLQNYCFFPIPQNFKPPFCLFWRKSSNFAAAKGITIHNIHSNTQYT